MFADKLNFLISIIGISGGELAHAVDLDPSYISRLRHGKRALPKGHNFTEPIASYFATHIKSDYQKMLICEAMGMEADWPEATEKAQKYILSWLLTDNSRQRDIIKNVFEKIVHSYPLDAAVYVENLPDLSEYRNDTREVYFGKSGKQEAFLHFLTIAADALDSDKMQVFCNEDLKWMSETPDFTLKVLSLLRVYAKSGNKIEIIHSLREDPEEMLESLQAWIPIYLTGYVEPYYYPNIREDFYRRTVFVIPGVVAMTSSSLDGNPCDAMTSILTDRRAIKVMQDELNYLTLQSKPLAKVFSTKNKEGLNNLLKDFLNAKADTILVHENISPFILPESIRKTKETRDCFYFKSIERLLKKYNYTEVISMPDVDKICSGKVPVQLSDIVGPTQIFFTKEEYLKNLYYLIDLLATEKNYNLLIKNHALQNMFLCIKKDTGIFFTKTQGAAMAYYVEQPNIVEVMWDFLKATNEEATPKNQTAVLHEFQELAKRVEATS